MTDLYVAQNCDYMWVFYMVWVLSQRAANGPAKSLNAVCSRYPVIFVILMSRNCPRKEALEPSTKFLPQHGRGKRADDCEKAGRSDVMDNITLFILFIYLLVVLSLHCCPWPSLVAASGGYSPTAVCSLLTVVASLVPSTGSRASRFQ